MLVAVMAGLLLARGDGSEAADDPRPASPTSPETTCPRPTRAPDDTTGGSSPGGDPDGGTGGLDPGGSAASADWAATTRRPRTRCRATTGTTPARLQFVEDCGSSFGTQAALVGGDPAALCGCVYDDMSTRTDFATFNAGWSSDEFDPGSELGQTLTDVLLGCAASAGA